MNGDSFTFQSKYILQELHTLNDSLAALGLAYFIKKFVRLNVVVGEFVLTHIVSRWRQKDFIQCYAGDWAGKCFPTYLFCFVIDREFTILPHSLMIILHLVITGSSEGIGKAYAEELAQRGLNVVLISNDVGNLQQAAIEISKSLSSM